MNILHITLFLSYCGFIWCSTCSSINDCITCVSSRSWIPIINDNCRWCPLSGKCHAYGSLVNPCPSGGSATTTAQCYEKNNGNYDPENAYIHTLLSAVAYSDYPKKCIDQLFPRGGFKLLKAIGRKCNKLPFTYKECYAMVAVSDYSKLIVVAYRGTSSPLQLADEIVTTLAAKKSFESGGNVQKYFYDAFQQLYPCAKAYVKTLFESKPDYTVVITGHSLGGAMASLMAVSLINDEIIPEDRLSSYTFGMPRVGDKNYALAYDELVSNSWRVVHYKDFVTRIPPRVIPVADNQPYHHKTEIYYYEDDMPPNSNYTVCASNEDDKCVNSHTFNPLEYASYVRYHTSYFNLQVGEQCSNIGARRKRSADGSEISEMSRHFSNDTCKLVDIGDEVNRSQRTTQYGYQLTVLCSSLAYLAYVYIR